MQKRYGEDWVCRVLVSGRAGMRDLQGVSRSRQHAVRQVQLRLRPAQPLRPPLAVLLAWPRLMNDL